MLLPGTSSVWAAAVWAAAQAADGHGGTAEW